MSLITKIPNNAIRSAAVVAAFAVAAFCRAESFPAPTVAADSLDAKVVAQLQTQAQIHADDMFDYLLLKIDELDRICHLKPQQQAKFKIAAKGAVNRAVTKWIDAAVQATRENIAAQPKQANQNANAQVAAAFGGGGFPGNGFGGGFVAQGGKIVVDGGNVIVFNPANNNVQILQLNDVAAAVAQQAAVTPEFDVRDVEREGIWTLAERNLLNLDQSLARGEALQARTDLPRGNTVNRLLTELDSLLLLDASQRDAFDEAIRPVINQYVGAGQIGIAPSSADVSRNVLSSPARERFAKILSERQMNYWKLTSQDGLPRLHNGAGFISDKDHLIDLIQPAIHVTHPLLK